MTLCIVDDFTREALVIVVDVTLEALRGDRTIQEIAAWHNVLPTQVSAWKKTAVEGMADVFAKCGGNADRESEVKELHAEIGRLAVENDFLAKGLKL